MSKANTRLVGHELRNEGRLYDPSIHRYVNGPGRAQCSCGEPSATLPSTGARKRWHRAHKDDIRQGGNGKVGQS